MDPSYIGVFLLGLVINAGILRWILKINNRVSNQEIIIRLLAQLLNQQGLSPDEVKKILDVKYK